VRELAYLIELGYALGNNTDLKCFPGANLGLAYKQWIQPGHRFQTPTERVELASSLFSEICDRAENWPQAAPVGKGLGICSAYGPTWTCKYGARILQESV